MIRLVNVRRLLVGVLAGLLLPATGVAQERGPGVRAGSVEIHPSVSLEGATTTTSSMTPPPRGGRLRTRRRCCRWAGLTLENRNATNIGFSLGGKFVYRHLTSLDDPDGRIDDRVVEARNGLASASGQAMIALLPRSAVTLSCTRTYATRSGRRSRPRRLASRSWTTRPAPTSGSARVAGRWSFAWAIATGSSTSSPRPKAGSGPGREERPRDAPADAVALAPKTSFVVDLQYGVIDYARPQERLTAGGGTVLSADRDSRPFRLEAGLRGLADPADLGGGAGGLPQHLQRGGQLLQRGGRPAGGQLRGRADAERGRGLPARRR
ncbi:MAG: hypothetical protein R3F43_29910 [bacterium]